MGINRTTISGGDANETAQVNNNNDLIDRSTNANTNNPTINNPTVTTGLK